MQIPLSECYNKVNQNMQFSNQIEIYFFPSNSPEMRELTLLYKIILQTQAIRELGHPPYVASISIIPNVDRQEGASMR